MKKKEGFKDKIPMQFKAFKISPKQKFIFLLGCSFLISIKALQGIF